MSTDTPSESITELLSYSQADEEGVIVKVSRQAIHEVVAENARLREELELIRAALTGDDYASLPSDLPTVRMAHTIRADHDKFRNQVRDTCHRAEQAEARALANEKERDEIAGLNQDQFLQLEYLRPVFEAAHALYMESEEYDFDDGLGRGAQQQFWDALASSFEPATEAIDAAIGAKHD